MKQVDDETKEILESFIAEAFERLDDAEEALSKAECQDDSARLGTVFRLFHSVKGSAAFLELKKVCELTHEAETLLDFHVKGRRALSPDSLDVVFRTIDLLRALVREVQASYGDDGHDAEVADQITAIRDSVESARSEATATPAAELAAPAAEPRDGGRGGDRSPNEIVLNELVTAEMTERFLSESLDLVDRLESGALELQASSDPVEDVHSMFRAVHTIKGNAGFFGYGLLESLCMEAESHLDTARRGAVQPGEPFVNGVLSRVDVIRKAIRSVAVSAAQGGPYAGAGSAPPEAASTAGAQDIGAVAYKPIGEILVDMGEADPGSVQKALEMQQRPLGELLVESGAATRDAVTRALATQRDMESKVPSGSQAGEEPQRREVRVDTVKLDKLFDLVGELITAEAMVVNSPDLKGIKLDHFEKSFTALSKISREIQETMMVIRMIPMEGLFNKMTRLVRDLSRKFGKPIDFMVSGQETEMDRNVIEQVSDPLVHLLRNSIDHGLETPEERKAAGKPATGVVSLDARYEGSEIWVSVKDDGKGLSRERILAKAAERGLLKADPASLEDKDVWAFIFEPGFSTAQVVSDVSGRGVGLDVVRKNLDRIRGAVDVRSTAGQGTEFVLRIPLTMAIIEGITVRVGASCYSIPLSDILEFFKARPGQITRTADGGELVDLRGDILPLVKLWQVFKVAGAAKRPEDGILLVVHAGGRKAGLLIDEVVGNQQIVIKSLSEYLGKVDGVSGCSILGDGSVSFIVDTARLLSMVLE